MELRGIPFGSVFDASGVRGFFGEGYWYHRYLRPLGLRFDHATFVAKTTTLLPRVGNMPMRSNGVTPIERRPQCIVVRPFRGVALNAVGLSGPGAQALLGDGRWQRRTEPFFLSFMSVAQTVDERWRELALFVALLQPRLREFRAPIGLQINFSCPNVGVHSAALVEEALSALGIASKLGIPLMPKLNILAPVAVAKEISEHPACDALCVSNTIPWGSLPDRIPWRELFSSDESPLAQYGGGGLSGAPLLPLVAAWVRDARAAGITTPINAGGGILAPRDVDVLHDAGASSVFIGSMAILRGWRIARTIARARYVFALNPNGGTHARSPVADHSHAR